MNFRFRIRDKIWIVFAGIALFMLIGAVWIQRTYGTLIFAMADESFKNGFKNKRSLFAKEVLLPTLIVIVILLFANKMMKETVKYKMMYVMVGATVVSVCIAYVVLDAGPCLERQYRMSQEQWYTMDHLVVHALGSIDNVRYTNSREALENSFLNGNKLFECDMIMTADEKLVACHDWEFWRAQAGVEIPEGEEYIPTRDAFLRCKLMGRYTPLSGEDIVLFLKEHPEVYIITDTKYVEPDEVIKQFQELVNMAEALDCRHVLDQFVVQIYHAYMYDIIAEIYEFSNYIFTLYCEGYDGGKDRMKEYAEFCMLHNIDVITMHERFFCDDLLEICDQYGIRLFIHTVNDQNEIEALWKKGVGVYTDNVLR